MAEASSALTILLIDDDAQVREVVTMMIAALGHVGIQASSGREGLAILGAGRHVDLVLTDLHMPEMDGWQVVKAVRARWPGMRVGVLTGTPEALYGREEDLDCLILKPLKLATLRAVLAGLTR